MGSGGYTWLCSADADGYALDNTDWNDSCYCLDNDEDICIDCEGNCKYLSGSGYRNTAYLAWNDDEMPNPDLNYDCPEPMEMAGHKGCDVCGTCGGSGEPTWYLDDDGDGWGDPLGTLDCSNSASCANNSDTTKVDC